MMAIKLKLGKILPLFETMAQFLLRFKTNRLNSTFINQRKRV